MMLYVVFTRSLFISGLGAVKSAACSSISVSQTIRHISVLLFFFFQAEDGIRDIGVTGVQTCALPILLVAEFLAGGREIGDPDVVVDDGVVDQGLAVVRRMWEIGVAHRDVKPANVLVRDGTLFLIDSAFAEVRPSPWRQAVDLANMMLVLALRTDAPRVYRRARLHFSDEEIAEAFAATRGLTMPSQLRRMLRQQGRDLHAEFLALLPYRLPPVRIQRWSMRRVGLTAATLLCLVLASGLAVKIGR